MKSIRWEITKPFVSGGGALDKNVGEFLNAIGLPTLQGYGLYRDFSSS